MAYFMIFKWFLNTSVNRPKILIFCHKPAWQLGPGTVGAVVVVLIVVVADEIDGVDMADDWTLKVAAHLPIIDEVVQNELEASLVNFTVIMLDIESVGGGAKNPVWLTRRGNDEPSKTCYAKCNSTSDLVFTNYKVYLNLKFN